MDTRKLTPDEFERMEKKLISHTQEGQGVMLATFTDVYRVNDGFVKFYSGNGFGEITFINDSDLLICI